MALTPEQRSQRASIAALARWSREDPAPTAKRGQDGLLARFRAEIAAEFPGLSEAELNRRTEVRRREHMRRLAFNSSKTRGRAAEQSEAA